MSPDLLIAIKAVARAVPANIDDKVTVKATEPGKPPELLTFDDGHSFTIRLPAWALRTIKAAMVPTKSPYSDVT